MNRGAVDAVRGVRGREDRRPDRRAEQREQETPPLGDFVVAGDHDSGQRDDHAGDPDPGLRTPEMGDVVEHRRESETGTGLVARVRDVVAPRAREVQHQLEHDRQQEHRFDQGCDDDRSAVLPHVRSPRAPVPDEPQPGERQERQACEPDERGVVVPQQPGREHQCRQIAELADRDRRTRDECEGKRGDDEPRRPRRCQPRTRREPARQHQQRDRHEDDRHRDRAEVSLDRPGDETDDQPFEREDSEELAVERSGNKS